MKESNASAVPSLTHSFLHAVGEKLCAGRVPESLVVRLQVDLDRGFEIGGRVGINLSGQVDLFLVEQAKLRKGSLL